MISSIRSTDICQKDYSSASKASTSASAAEKGKFSRTLQSDTIEISKKASLKETASDTIEAVREQAEQQTANLRALVRQLINNQSETGTSVKAVCEEIMPTLDESTVIEVQESVSEDGEYGIEAVSDRIVDFAVAISGGDKSKLTELKSAIEQGFSEAEKAFGAALPDICQKTHDRIMEKLDAWALDE